MPLLSKFPRQPSSGDNPVFAGGRTSTHSWIAALLGAAVVSGLIFYVLGFRAGENALRQAGWLHRRLDAAAGELKNSSSGPAANPMRNAAASSLATAVPAPRFPAGNTAAAPVRLTRPITSSKPETSRLPPAEMRASRARVYAVQVFAGRLKSNAQGMASRLKKFGLPVQLLPPGTAAGSSNHYYRVQAGPFENREQAESALRHLQSLGIPAFLAP